jgi:CubicO group peptidase (beta-lactamase class C family)
MSAHFCHCLRQRWVQMCAVWVMAGCVSLLSLAAWGQTSSETTNLKMADATSRIFKEWLSENGIKDGAMVVMRSGQVLGRTEVGERKTNIPYTIASLTKAITGACTAQLIDTGKLKLTDTLADVLKVALAELPKPVDARFALITMSDLLRNRSGLSIQTHFTNGGNRAWMQGYPRKQKNMSQQLALVPRFDLAADPGSTYRYANVNWLLLGMVIEQVSGEAYEDYCYRAVLKPLNLPVSGLSPGWAITSSYGGWHISAEDYGVFAAQIGSSVMARKGVVNEWLLQLDADEGASGKAFYALGTNMRITAAGRTFWHSGSWQSRGSATDGFYDDSFGSHFASFDNGVTYAVNYSKAMTNQTSVLDKRMAQAIREVVR